MFKHTACLHDFIESTPVCFQTDTLAAVLDVLRREACDRLVIINEQQCPIGLIQLRHLMPLSPQIPLHQPLSQVGAPIVEPLPALPSDLSLSQCAAEFQEQDDRYWAVVGRDRHFQGLIDSFYLRKLTDLEVPTALDPDKNVDGSPDLAALDLPPPEFDHLKQHLRVQIAKLRSQLQPTSSPPSLPSPAIHSLMQFLERLPLPLMLQTNTGRSLAQNSFWHEQLGDLVDPGWVQRDADAVLEFASHLAHGEAATHDSTPQPGLWERSVGTFSESA
ncbi:MAG: CBS domain-containing protein [Leptolyngbyaceae cyanobacterium CSU_1_3]|nr:CBS domain-containing protein [Leptolyngbyaceae cyanobacterium CSU_1_3]